MGESWFIILRTKKIKSRMIQAASVGIHWTKSEESSDELAVITEFEVIFPSQLSFEGTRLDPFTHRRRA